MTHPRARHTAALLMAALLLGGAMGARAQTLRAQRALGGTAADQFYHGVELPGQSVLLVGSTRSNDDDLAGRAALDLDGWLVRLGQQGELMWQQAYGGTGNDELRMALALPDGGFIAVGHTESAPLSKGGRDAWLVRTDGLGRLLWQRAYGGSGNDAARAIVALPDGGYVVVGETGSADIAGLTPRGATDAWLMRLDSRGAVLWQRSYGGSGADGLWSVATLGDGTYVACGGTESSDGDMPPGRGKTDGLLLQVSGDGSLRWRRTYGGSSFDEFYSLAPYQGGLAVVGTAQSRDGDVRGHRGNGDVWLLSTDASGLVRTSACYGGTGDEGGNYVSPTRDGGLLVAATARSRDGQRTVFRGVFDGWLLRIDAGLGLRWQKSIGGFQNDAFTWAAESAAGGHYLVAGHTVSTDLDLAETITHGSVDAWYALVADPTTPEPKAEPLPTLLAGYVTDRSTGRRLAADVTLVDYATLKPIRAVRTDTASALYQLVLTRATGLGLSVLAPGYLMENLALKIIPAQVGTQVRLDVALVPIRRDTSINLHHIYFETGSPKLKTESTLELQKLLQFLRENPSLTVRIIGHTDATSANETARLQLSRYRALEVKSYLQERGIAGPRMEAIGVGSSRPLADERTDRGRALNRRVEIEITAH